MTVALVRLAEFERIDSGPSGRVGLGEWELIYCDSRCSELSVDQSHPLPAMPDSAQELQLKVFTEAR